MKGCHVQLHSFLSWRGSSLPVHTDWCVYTHGSIVSHHLGKNIIAKLLAREQKQKQEPGLEDWKGAGNLRQPSSTAEYSQMIQREEMMPCAVII